ncbi:phosphatase PAP2 family protein [Phaeacidiphilus oryzae]|uniref:phosphatase PAP2 family protein n=1 Tax=Phaeacidiphilus oryzae TaxID=348818 RepID=UPI00055CA45F|nr:phosphatase PAP2 family protein [Phaeacidiphilus oryzae]
MTPLTTLAASLDGRSIDGSLYTWFQDQVAKAPTWLNDFLSFWATYGLVLFAVLFVIGWWQARREGPAKVAQSFGVALAVLLGYVVNDIVKSVFDEVRPCQAIPGTHTLQPCPGVGDWSFPSNHSSIGMAAAVALLMLDRKLGSIALLGALVLGLGRVWIGAHYPHDVLVGWAVGAIVGALCGWLSPKAAPLVVRLSRTPLRPLLTAGATAAH